MNAGLKKIQEAGKSLTLKDGEVDFALKAMQNYTMIQKHLVDLGKKLNGGSQRTKTTEYEEIVKTLASQKPVERKVALIMKSLDG